MPHVLGVRELKWFLSDKQTPGSLGRVWTAYVLLICLFTALVCSTKDNCVVPGSEMETSYWYGDSTRSARVTFVTNDLVSEPDPLCTTQNASHWICWHCCRRRGIVLRVSRPTSTNYVMEKVIIWLYSTCKMSLAVLFEPTEFETQSHQLQVLAIILKAFRYFISVCELETGCYTYAVERGSGYHDTIIY